MGTVAYRKNSINVDLDNAANYFQNISFLGMVHRISGREFSDMFILLPAMLLFLLPFVRTRIWAAYGFNGDCCLRAHVYHSFQFVERVERLCYRHARSWHMVRIGSVETYHSRHHSTPVRSDTRQFRHERSDAVGHQTWAYTPLFAQGAPHHHRMAQTYLGALHPQLSSAAASSR